MKMTMGMIVFAVLFFAAGLGPARSRGNHNTREKAAGKTRWGKRQLRCLSDQNGLRGRRFSPAPSLVRAARHSGWKSPLFPVRDLSEDFFRLVENDLLQILQYKGLETPVSSPSTMV
jgi:hypothetical protein